MSRYAFLFPGQGSQHPGMGRSLYETFAEAREVFERVDAALDLAVSTLCFEGDEAELARTENTQPAILTVSLATLRVLERSGLRAVAAAGHSLGEYGALVAAGTLESVDAVRCVRERGRFMQEAVPVGVGSMAAILGLGAKDVSRICEQAMDGEVVAPANLNSPEQTVIAGHRAAVERAGALALEAGARRVIPLRVSAPFHCKLMEPAARRLRPVLERLDFHAPSITVYSNVAAAPIEGAEHARTALLSQVTSPVRWHESIEAMLASGIDTFVEVGPGKVLAGIVRSINRACRVLPAGDPAAIEATVHELSLAA